MTSQYQMISDIGRRLKSYRLGAGLTPEEVAAATGISRAAIYRYESGQPIRVDALGKIADLLDVSLASLFGVGSENISSAITFFERLRQIESEVDQITVLFGPVPYLLTTDAYDEMLPQVLRESVPETAANRDGLENTISQLMDILLQRKQQFRERKPNIIGLVSATDLEQFVASGFVGNLHGGAPVPAERFEVARQEIRNIQSLIEEQPIGMQIGIVQDSMPSTIFQILRKGTSAQVATSPFRLGASANVRIGVATITAAEESVKLHQSVAERIWQQSLKGQEATELLQRIMDVKA
ncbi:helix-turn-helix domain-containing protein [Neptunicoccus cionae]|uniref:helix-turn-helix domain-containing protein n=1 Tax=Neptunicoccus cionae TaxID=2035344 RepID=UPI000C766044|nr:helix-turn-helix transcriptional regulator [Amylibacter cionae]PLS20432.1 transcriptional regulator [Amylibacter cionae]